MAEHLRQRNFILCFVGADSYAFVHRTFLEYFCAADLVHQFNVAKTLDNDGLMALFEQHCRDDEWREVIDTSLTGAFNVARRAVSSMMKARWGRLVFISSVAGHIGTPGQANYAASKAGIVFSG